MSEYQVSYDEAIDVFWKMYHRIWDSIDNKKDLDEFNKMQHPLQTYIKERNRCEKDDEQ